MGKWKHTPLTGFLQGVRMSQLRTEQVREFQFQLVKIKRDLEFIYFLSGSWISFIQIKSLFLIVFKRDSMICQLSNFCSFLANL